MTKVLQATFRCILSREKHITITSNSLPESGLRRQSSIFRSMWRTNWFPRSETSNTHFSGTKTSSKSSENEAFCAGPSAFPGFCRFPPAIVVVTPKSNIFHQFKHMYIHIHIYKQSTSVGDLPNNAIALIGNVNIPFQIKCKASRLPESGITTR